jgi:AIPR protein
LLGLARTSAKSTFTLALAENPVSAAGDVGFVGLVYIRDYFRFITDEKKQSRRQIFEANVRDYQGSTEVNAEIQQTLKQRSNEDFWWLNNGVTVVASRASLSAKALTIEDPQIVNGLQTSSEVFNYFTTSNTDGDDRKLLVRVIVPSDAASRDRVIKAINSQTAVRPASLRATDKIHRDIEEYLRPRGLYYDRRKNYYKNEGKPLDRIIGIPQLAQATMSIVLG